MSRRVDRSHAFAQVVARMGFFSSGWVVVLSLLMAGVAFAWQPGQRIDVTLRSGEELVATLVSENSTGLIVDTDLGKRLLRFDEIFQVRASVGVQRKSTEKKAGRRLDVTLRSGEELTGTLISETASGLTLDTTRGERSLRLDEIFQMRASTTPSSLRREARPVRVGFGVFIEVGGGVGVIHSRAIDAVRCVPCVEQRAMAAFDSALGASISVSFSEHLSLRTSLSGFFRIAPFVSGGAQLGAELFFSPNATLSFGLGGRGGVVMWQELTPVFGVVVTPLSWRFSPHHRVSVPLHLSVAWSDYELTHFAAPHLATMDFASPRSVTDTNVGFFGGLQYELQF